MTVHGKLPLAAAIVVALAGTAVHAGANPAALARIKSHMKTAPGVTLPEVSGPSGVRASAQSVRYIVTFQEPALAAYRGGDPRFAAIPRVTAGGGRGEGRLDVKSAEARHYVDYLADRQTIYLDGMQQALGHALKVDARMQYALNAAVVRMSAEDAGKVARIAGVVSVERDRMVPLATDIGPGFIGASNIWFGQQAGQDTIFLNNFDGDGQGYRGEGTVIGDLDTGYNSLSPSFSATEDGGYSFTNPLGAGNYLGMCNEDPPISLGGCNDKIIGAYDFVDPDSPFMVEDVIGHGSHTASTAGGNGRWASINGYYAHISGVAPHANMVIYRVCDNSGCLNSNSAQAVDQAIQDGVVDTLNFSISGGGDPWGGAVEQAFLNASNAGIFVAAAAGNTSQSVPDAVPGTVNHWEPWVTTVAAGTHTGGSLGATLNVTGPGSPPASVQAIGMPEASNDSPMSSPLPASTPLVLSPAFQNQSTAGTDGCSSYQANTFDNAVALISRGSCSFYTKTINAEAAGAIAVVISNNQPGELSITVAPPAQGGPAVAVPVWTVTQSQGTSLQSWANGHPNPVASVSAPHRLDAQPDVLADFSLLGPGNSGVIKPDVQAPGVKILAAVANDGSANGPDKVAFYDGTSMATPHTTGAATLLMGLHPGWTPSEVKSALMMTSRVNGLTKPDKATPSDPYDRGAGRIQVDLASHAGLVMNETGPGYQTADPSTGGDPSSLNIASMENLDCYTASANVCSFVRSFRSTSDQTVNWTASVTGELAGSITVAPSSSFTSLPGGTNSIQVTVNSNGFINSGTDTSDGSPHFGELVLTPDDGSPELHLPIAAAIPPPVINTPATAQVDLQGTPSGQALLSVGNTGGPTLQYLLDTTPDSNYDYYVLQANPSGGNYGYFSTLFPDVGNIGFYAAQPFEVTGAQPMNLSTIYAQGFSVGQALSLYPDNTPLHVAIYADAGGHPAGNPESGAVAPVWQDDTTLKGGDALLIGDSIAVFPSTATQLVPGKYWVTVYPELPCAPNSGGACTRGWAWFLTSDADAPVGQSVFPASSPDWASTSENLGFALYLDSYQPCDGISWLNVSPTGGYVGGMSSTSLTLTADDSFSGPAATDYLCLSSNSSDGHNPAIIQVTATK